MSDSNGNGTLKRARSSSPVSGQSVASGKKQNTGNVTSDVATPGEAVQGENGKASASDAEVRKSDGSTEAKGQGKTEGDSTASAAAAGEAPAPSITIRALIVTQDASIIIGKAGSHIKEIRDRAGAKVSVSEQYPNNPERILHVTGPLDAVSKAYGLIVRKINDEPYDQPSVPGSRAVTIKYIIPNSRMGSVIGKGGSKIKEIQEASGARLQASESMLPGSTERILSVSGVADAIHIAVYYVGTILQEGSDRPSTNTAYRPSALGPGGYGGQFGSQPGGGGSSYAPSSRYQGAAGGAGGSSYYPQGQPGYGYGGAPAPPQGNNPYATASTASAPGSQTQQIYIPNELVGNIIGKGGQKINEIRQMSGCSIKIMEQTEDQGTGARPHERLVTITGLPHNIQTAVQMLHTRLESEKQKKMAAGGY